MAFGIASSLVELYVVLQKGIKSKDVQHVWRLEVGMSVLSPSKYFLTVTDLQSPFLS